MASGVAEIAGGVAILPEQDPPRRALVAAGDAGGGLPGEHPHGGELEGLPEDPGSRTLGAAARPGTLRAAHLARHAANPREGDEADPPLRAESQLIGDHPRNRSGHRAYRLWRGALAWDAACRAGRRRDRDARGRSAGAPACGHPRARVRPDPRARARRACGRGPLLRAQRPQRIRGRPGARGRAAVRRHGRASRASRIRRRRSSRRSAAAARPRRSRCSAWSARCSRCPSRRDPDHAADALAVAICHANGAPLKAALG